MALIGVTITGGTGRSRLGLTALIVIVLLAAGSGPQSAGASPLNWSGPAQIDTQAPFGEPGYIAGISCPSDALCVGVDEIGDVVTSTNPTGGASTWATSTIRKTTFPNGFNSVSCSSDALCVAVDGDGDVATTTNPDAGAPAWSLGHVEGSEGLSDISCPAASFCVATGFSETGDNLAYSTDPSSGASSWRMADIGGRVSLNHVSCASASFCLAAEAYGANVYTSAEPTGGPTAWAKTTLPGSSPEILSADCSSASLCVVGTFAGVLASSNPTGGTGTWTEAAIGAVRGLSCPEDSLCVGMQEGRAVSSTNPTGGTGAWHASAAPLLSTAYEDVSCASASFCASSLGQNVAYSTEPTNTAASAWHEGQVDHEGFTELSAMSCPSVGLCVAGDAIGKILTSTNPTSGIWSATRIANGNTYESRIQALSCASTSFCVAAGAGGRVYTSTDPTGGASTWHAATIAPNVIDGISCPATTLCVATDITGAVLTSTNPTGGASAWQRFPVDTEADDGYGYGGPTVTCPSTALCLAVNRDTGNLISSTNPTGGTGAWSVAKLSEGIAAVACPSTTFCVAVSSDPNQLSWFSANPTGGAAAWASTSLQAINAVALSCPSTNLCAAGGYLGPDEENVAATANPAAGGATWQGIDTDPSFYGDTRTTTVACPGASLCILGDSRGNVYVGTPSGEEGGGLPGAGSPGGSSSGGSGSAGGSAESSPSTPAPVAGPPAATKPSPSAESRSAVAGAIAPVKDGDASLTLRCPPGADCSGVAKLEVLDPSAGQDSFAQARTKRSPTVIGSAHFKVAAGKKGLVRIPLSRRGKALLASAGRKGLRATLVGTGLKSRTVVLRAS